VGAHARGLQRQRVLDGFKVDADVAPRHTAGATNRRKRVGLQWESREGLYFWGKRQRVRSLERRPQAALLRVPLLAACVAACVAAGPSESRVSASFAAVVVFVECEPKSAGQGFRRLREGRGRW
jgi:hypothetical protein